MICKEYGKAKIYFVDQSTLNSTCTQEDLDKLQGDSEDRKKQVDESGRRRSRGRASELNGFTNDDLEKCDL